MTRQLPVMQLQSFNYPKNVPSPSLMTTTSSLINNNSLLTFRDIMMQQQQQHYQLRKNENENCLQSSSSISLASSSSLSPNAPAKLLHHHTAAEKHEKTHHPLSINKHETAAAPCSVAENGSKLNNSANRCNKAENYPYSGGGSGKTVREELEASRSKIPKLGEFENIHSTLFFVQCTGHRHSNNNPHDTAL